MSRLYLEEKEIPAVNAYLNEIKNRPAANPLADYLKCLASEKPMTQDVFKAGVAEFVKIANLHSSQRAAFFGESFAGLHYNNDLTALWNARHPDKTTTAAQVSRICPSEWHYSNDDNLYIVYKGNNPARALNKLLQGPTTIDCGMFCQLSILFGIRFVLGDQKFNQIFGNTPLYITQYFYNGIKDAKKPYFGNPLFGFFDSEGDINSVMVTHVENFFDYLFKHPGGNYQGDNCVVIDGLYIVFDPGLSTKINLSKAEVGALLRDAFNAPQDQRDRDRVAVYKALSDQSAIHPKVGLPYSALIELSEMLAKKTISDSEFNFPIQAQLTFNFKKFVTWANNQCRPIPRNVNYLPLTDEQLSISETLLEKIPYENRHTMSFSTFKTETDLQRDLFQLSLHFCNSVMQHQSNMTVLTGKAGIGKTAAAVSCIKELTARGKKAVWITEVTVKGWMDQAKSMAGLEESRQDIQKLLQSNPDAVFLDDDNMAGCAGKTLLEEIYAWYVCNSGKGLFITSNEPISFEQCYGWKLDQTYHLVPFPGYTSAAMQGMMIHANLTGQSHRPALMTNIADLNDHEKISRLMRVPEDVRSVGIIVTPEIYQQYSSRFESIEYIPAFVKDSECLLAPIRRSLCSTGTLGPAYDLLTPAQKKWSKRFTVPTLYFSGGHKPEHPGIAVRKFEKTNCSVIAVELQHDTFNFLGHKIFVDCECLSQLLRVVNYAHDCGGKKIIIVNATPFTQQQLMEKIKEGIDERERERSMARINQLLFSDALLIEYPPQVAKPKPFQVTTERISTTSDAALFNRRTAHSVYLRIRQRQDENQRVLNRAQTLVQQLSHLSTAQFLARVCDLADAAPTSSVNASNLKM